MSATGFIARLLQSYQLAVRTRKTCDLIRIAKRCAGAHAFVLNMTDVEETMALTAPTGPLAGVTVAVKDVFCTQILPTTAASKMLSSAYGFSSHSWTDLKSAFVPRLYKPP